MLVPCWWWRGANGATQRPHFVLYSAAARARRLLAPPTGAARRHGPVQGIFGGVTPPDAGETRHQARVNCCSSLRGHRSSGSVASQILQQLLANLILYSYLCLVVNFYTTYLIHMTADW